MKTVMPQEIEVWYLIPALRKELSKVLVKEYKMKQKNAAQCLGITEAAVSQYLKSRRGNEIKFTKKQQDKIKEVAKEMVDGKINIMEKLYDLCVFFRGSKFMCDLHKLHDKRVPKNCKACCGKE